MKDKEWTQDGSFDERVDNRAHAVMGFEWGEYNLDVFKCPFCHGAFAVDYTYLDQVDLYVHCPMCCMEVLALEGDLSNRELAVLWVDVKLEEWSDCEDCGI